jgi:hypothetical protein
MRIVIEIDGDKVTAVRGLDVPGVSPSGATAEFTEAMPSAPPPALLERAKKLGAMSAGAAQFGVGAALAATAPAGETPRLERPARSRKTTIAKGRRRKR